MNDFYVKMAVTLVTAVGIFVVMLISERRRYERDKRRFDQFLKARGMNPEIEKKDKGDV